nr:hypothetical protein GCM10025730_04390 [Promicromonospora thailandica]
MIALNLYSRDASPWDARALAAAESYTQLVAAAVRLHLEVAELEDRATGLYRTMSDEVAIQRAVGTIMATNDCSAQEAARILDSAAATRGVSRREVAETILRTLASEES